MELGFPEGLVHRDWAWAEASICQAFQARAVGGLEALRQEDFQLNREFPEVRAFIEEFTGGEGGDLEAHQAGVAQSLAAILEVMDQNHQRAARKTRQAQQQVLFQAELRRRLEDLQSERGESLNASLLGIIHASRVAGVNTGGAEVDGELPEVSGIAENPQPERPDLAAKQEVLQRQYEANEVETLNHTLATLERLSTCNTLISQELWRQKNQIDNVFEQAEKSIDYASKANKEVSKAKHSTSSIRLYLILWYLGWSSFLLTFDYLRP